MANRFQAQLAREAGSWCAPGPAGDPVYGLVESASASRRGRAGRGRLSCEGAVADAHNCEGPLRVAGRCGCDKQWLCSGKGPSSRCGKATGSVTTSAGF